MQSFSPYYNYDYGNGFNYGNTYDGMAESVISIFLLVFFISTIPLIISIAKYILMSIGLYKIASRRNLNYSFLAFIPIANSYLLGFIYDDINKTMNRTTKTAMKLLILRIVTSCATLILMPFTILSYYVVGVTGTAVAVTVIASLVGAALFVLSVIYYVYYFIALYGIYKEYAYDKAVLFLVISILFFVLAPLFVFLIRNNKSGYELWQKQREQQQFSTTETKFEEEVTESAVEEVFVEVPTEDEQEQTIIENDEQPIDSDINE